MRHFQKRSCRNSRRRAMRALSRHANASIWHEMTSSAPCLSLLHVLLFPATAVPFFERSMLNRTILVLLGAGASLFFFPFLFFFRGRRPAHAIADCKLQAAACAEGRRAVSSTFQSSAQQTREAPRTTPPVATCPPANCSTVARCPSPSSRSFFCRARARFRSPKTRHENTRASVCRS